MSDVPAQIWQCEDCGRTFREYVNGCPNHVTEDPDMLPHVRLMMEVVPDE